MILLDEYYESSFNDNIRKIEYDLTCAISHYVESAYEGYYTEKTNKTLWDALKEFFAKIMVQINTYARDLQAKIEDTVRKKEIYRKLKELKEDLDYIKTKGSTTVEVMDVWRYRDTYLRMNKELWKIASKFTKTRYSNTYQVDSDLKEFDTIVDSYIEELKKIQDTTIKVNLNKMIEFVDDELKGKSDVIATLNESMSKFREMEREASNLKTRMTILGEDVIPKHVGFIKRMVRRITDFIHSAVVKFITTVVFIFA